MTTGERRPRDGRTTRDLILTAAARRFATQSYEATGLRDIARDVGVDVALVHRAYGSKEKLFIEALAHAVRPASAVEMFSRESGADLARRAFEDDPERETVADPLALMVHSIASPGALPLIRRIVASEFIAPLADRLDAPGAARAAVIAACLFGIRIFRDVLEVEAMNAAARPDLEPLIAEVFSTILFGQPGRSRSPHSTSESPTVCDTAGPSAGAEWNSRSAFWITHASVETRHRNQRSIFICEVNIDYPNRRVMESINCLARAIYDYRTSFVRSPLRSSIWV